MFTPKTDKIKKLYQKEQVQVDKLEKIFNLKQVCI